MFELHVTRNGKSVDNIVISVKEYGNPPTIWDSLSEGDGIYKNYAESIDEIYINGEIYKKDESEYNVEIKAP